MQRSISDLVGSGAFIAIEPHDPEVRGTLEVTVTQAELLRPTRLPVAPEEGGGLAAVTLAGEERKVATASCSPYVVVAMGRSGHARRTETAGKQMKWAGGAGVVGFELAGPPEFLRILCFDQLNGPAMPAAAGAPPLLARRQDDDAFIGAADWFVTPDAEGQLSAEAWVELHLIGGDIWAATDERGWGGGEPSAGRLRVKIEWLAS